MGDILLVSLLVGIAGFWAWEIIEDLRTDITDLQKRLKDLEERGET